MLQTAATDPPWQMWWPIIVQRVQVQVLSPSTEASRPSGEDIHMVASPRAPHMLDHMIIFLR